MVALLTCTWYGKRRCMGIDYRHEPTVEYGVELTCSQLIRRVVAKNPSPFTYHGTQTYVVGRGNVVLVDPGPLLPEHAPV